MMNKSRLLAISVAFLAALAQISLAAEATYYVRGDGVGSDAANGTGWGTAFATIQRAINQSAVGTNIIVNVQGGYTYAAGAVKSMGYVGIIAVQGGWMDIGGTPIQNGYSTISDTNGPIDQPGLTILATSVSGGHSGVVSRVNFTNVTYGVYVGETAASGIAVSLAVSNCNVAAQSHGIFMEYGNGASTPGRGNLFVTNSTIHGGLGGFGDGIRLGSFAYNSVVLGSGSTVASAGGVNLYVQDPGFSAVYGGTNVLKASFGAAAGGYDMVHDARMESQTLTDSSTFTRPISFNGGIIEAVAQSSGRPLGVSTTELNSASELRLDAVNGVSDTPFGPIVARKGESIIWLRMGVSGSGTWTSDSLVRQNRATLALYGNNPEPYQLGVYDKFRVAGLANTAMVDPYFLDSYGNFLGYDTTLGFSKVVYSLTNNIDTSTADKVLLCNAVQQMTGARSVYAVFVSLAAANNLTVDASPRLLTIGSGGFTAGGANNTATISPNLRFGVAGEKEALVSVNFENPSADLTHSGTLILNGTLNTTNGLTKSGLGMLRLNADNSSTLSGPITVNRGGLQLGVQNALPSGQPVSVFGGMSARLSTIYPGTYLDLNGNNLTAGQLTLAEGAYVVNTLGGSSSTLNLNGNVVYNGRDFGASIYSTNGFILALGNANRTFDVADVFADPELSVRAQITGTAGMTKAGPGRLELCTTNSTFTGGITILDGVLTGTTSNNLTGTGVQTPFGDANNAVAMTNTGSLMCKNPITAVVAGSSYMGEGDVTFAGGNKICFYSEKANYTTNRLASLNRTTNTLGVLVLQGSYPAGAANVYPGSYFTLLSTTAPSAPNGMVSAYIVLRKDRNTTLNADYVTYDATVGYKIATYEVTSLDSVTALQKANITSVQNVTVGKSLYALKTSADITNAASCTLTIGSGGVLFNGAATIQSAVKFGTNGTDEAVVFVNTPTLGYQQDAGSAPSLPPMVPTVIAGLCGTMTGSLFTTAGLTKFGDGMLVLNADNGSGFSGPVWIQAGAISMGHTNALGSSSGSDPIYLQADARLDIMGNYSLARPIIGVGARASQITTGPNVFTLAAGGSLTPGLNEVGAMQVEDMDFRGTYNWDYNATGADLIKAVNLSFGGGSATLKVKWLGTGSAPMGTYELFRYYGSAPANIGWSVQAPTGLAGTVQVDDTNKRVTLTLAGSSGASGTVVIVK